MTSKYRKVIFDFLDTISPDDSPDERSATLREIMIEYFFNRVPPTQLQLVFDEIAREYNVPPCHLDVATADPVKQMELARPVEHKKHTGKKRLTVAEMLAKARATKLHPTAAAIKNLMNKPVPLGNRDEIERSNEQIRRGEMPLQGVPNPAPHDSPDNFENIILDSLLEENGHGQDELVVHLEPEDEGLRLDDDFLLTPLEDLDSNEDIIPQLDYVGDLLLDVNDAQVYETPEIILKGLPLPSLPPLVQPLPRKKPEVPEYLKNPDPPSWENNRFDFIFLLVIIGVVAAVVVAIKSVWP